MRLILSTVLALTLAACVRESDPFDVEPKPAQVFAVLVAGSDSATVVLTRPGAERDFDPFNNTFGEYEPISDATVLLIQDADTIALAEHDSVASCAMQGMTAIHGRGCYSALLPGPVESGLEYRLEIELPDGTPVHGRTRIPTAPTVLSPEAGIRFDVACGELEEFGYCQGFDQPLVSFPVTWDAPEEGMRTELYLRTMRGYVSTMPPGGGPVECHVEPSGFSGPWYTKRESGAVTVWSIDCYERVDDSGGVIQMRWDSVGADLSVAVYDSSYASYADAIFGREAARHEAVTAGIDGALGVFGAVAVARREIMLVRETPAARP